MYPFAIEYALIGATIALLMWRSSGSFLSSGDGPADAPQTLSSPKLFFSRCDCRGSGWGWSAGAAVAAVEVANLFIFFSTNVEDEIEVYM